MPDLYIQFLIVKANVVVLFLQHSLQANIFANSVGRHLGIALLAARLSRKFWLQKNVFLGKSQVEGTMNLISCVKFGLIELTSHRLPAIMNLELEFVDYGEWDVAWPAAHNSYLQSKSCWCMLA